MTTENRRVIHQGGWYWSFDGENFETTKGAFRTPEEALDCAKERAANVTSKPTSIYLVFGEVERLRLADHIDGLIRQVNEDFSEYYAEDPFDCSFVASEAFDNAVKEVADKWQKEYNVWPVFINFRDETMEEIPLEA